MVHKWGLAGLYGTGTSSPTPAPFNKWGLYLHTLGNQTSFRIRLRHR